MTRIRQVIGEFVGSLDVSRGVWYSNSMSALRTFFQRPYFKRPSMDHTVVDYDLARSLYRNDNPDYNLGAGFVKPIINLAVEYIGLPGVSSDDADTDKFLGECLQRWQVKIQEALRITIRDSKCFLRYYQPSLTNKLMTEDDRRFGMLKVLLAEEVDLTFNPTDPDLVDRGVITHWIEMDERTTEEVVQGTAPRMKVHEVLEIIEPDEYRFFDKTEARELVTWRTRNTWGFVPIWPGYNEYAEDLSGGMSDIEPVLPFIQAFHEVFTDVLAAHKYHSIPKVKFNIKSVERFLKNNWPSLFDENTGQLKDGASVDWQGREIMFFEADEDAGFIEARSVLGDSKTLLAFLIDCICIAAETPRWALLAEEKPINEQDASAMPFQKKIARKRVEARDWLVMLCKMALVANGKTPRTVTITWPTIRILDLVNKGQAIQQIVLALDVAVTHEWISDKTAIKILGSLFDEVSAPDVEKAEAKNNLVITPPVAPTTPAPPASAKSTNGSGSKSSAKKALATTSASRS
jgi:hypothetical protein